MTLESNNYKTDILQLQNLDGDRAKRDKESLT